MKINESFNYKMIENGKEEASEWKTKKMQ